MFEDFPRTGDTISSDDRHPQSPRLQQRKRQAFVAGRENEDIRRAHNRIWIRHKARHFDELMQSQLRRQGCKEGSFGSFAEDDETASMAPLMKQVKRAQKNIETL